MIGSLLYFKKETNNGVFLYEKISTDFYVHVLIPVGNTFFYCRLWHFISVLHWKTQDLLQATLPQIFPSLRADLLPPQLFY